MSSAGTLIDTSASGAKAPPDRPVRTMVLRPRAFATMTAFETFFEFPEVLIPKQDIAGAPEAIDLLGENHFKIDVVGDRAGERDRRRQGNGGQRSLQTPGNCFPICLAGRFKLGHVRRGDRAALQKPLHQLRDHVLAVGGAAPIAANQEFVPGSISRDQEIKRGTQLLLAWLQNRIPLEEQLKTLFH